MNVALALTRVLFTILSLFLLTFYMVSGPEGFSIANAIIGIVLGGAFSCLLIGFDQIFKRFNLRSFNIVIVGLFFGYLMGQALVLIFGAILEISQDSVHFSIQTLEITQILLFLFGIYTGTLVTLRAADELYISIPFVKLTATSRKQKDFLIDSSLLFDARIIDLATSGLLDSRLILPRFIIRELYAQAEASDEQIRLKAKRALDAIKKIEGLQSLDLRYNDTDFPEVKDLSSKISRLARLLDANILSADVSQTQTLTADGLRFINIHELAKSLKPLMQTGEHIRIKIQRYGKEPRQGVGYLEDGTMVVVNGGGDFIGETIEVFVLSVKHTASGRMIFCNALSEKNSPYPLDDGEDDER